MTEKTGRRVLLIRPDGAGAAISRYSAGLSGLLGPDFDVEETEARHFEPPKAVRVLMRRTSPRPTFRTDVDLVHITDVYMSPQARRFDGARVVTVHDLMPREFRRIRSRRALTFAVVFERSLRMLRSVDLVVTPSEYTRQQLIAMGGIPAGKIVVVPPAFPEAMQPEPATVREPGTIVSVGPELYYKNLKTLIHSLAEPELRDARLIRVGHLSDGARETARRLGVEGRIEETGFLTDAELVGLYQRGAVLAQPSYSEGFGLPVAEAMLCGLPVVVSDGGALPEVAGTAGRVVPLRARRPRQPVDTDDARALALALAEVLGDEGLRRAMSEAGLREAERFRREAVRAQLLSAYELAFANARRRRGERE